MSIFNAETFSGSVAGVRRKMTGSKAIQNSSDFMRRDSEQFQRIATNIITDSDNVVGTAAPCSLDKCGPIASPIKPGATRKHITQREIVYCVNVATTAITVQQHLDEVHRNESAVGMDNVVSLGVEGFKV